MSFIVVRYSISLNVSSEARTCLQRSGNSTKETAHFTFIGDSRIRQLFLRFLNQIDPEAKASILQEYDGDGDDSHISNDEEESSRPLEKAHKSLFYVDSDYRFRVNFYWRPVFNKSAIDLLRQLSQGVVSADTEGSNVPKILVAGTGAWEMKLSNGSDKALENYVHYLSKIDRVITIDFHIYIEFLIDFLFIYKGGQYVEWWQYYFTMETSGLFLISRS